MKEKLKTLSLAELKELAKAQGLKGISSMRKQQLIDWLAERWEAEVKKQQEQKEEKAEKEAPKTETPKKEQPKAVAEQSPLWSSTVTNISFSLRISLASSSEKSTP